MIKPKIPYYVRFPERHGPDHERTKQYLEWMYKIKAAVGCCEICNQESHYRFEYDCQWHHIVDAERHFTLSQGARYSVEEVYKELCKVMLVCVSCHKKLHKGKKFKLKVEKIYVKDEFIQRMEDRVKAGVNPYDVQLVYSGIALESILGQEKTEQNLDIKA